MPKPRTTRRPRGFGNIEDRGRGKYRIRFCVDGQRHVETVEAASKKAAEDYATSVRQRLEREARRRRKGMPDRIRFSAMLDEFEQDKFPELAPGAQRSYLDSFKALKLYFVEKLGDPELGQLDAADIDRYASWRRVHRMGRAGGRVSGHTVGRDLRVLHRVLNVALRRQYIDANPAAAVDKPKPDARTYDILSDAEFERLLSNVTDPMFRTWLLLLAETGLRSKSEALMLRWEDVDLADGTLLVRSGRDGHRTKSGASRYVPLTARLKEALRAHFAAFRMKAYDGKRSPWVFHQQRPGKKHRLGDRIQSYAKAFATAKKAAKLPATFRIHDLRHRRVTTWLAAGKPAALVQEALGHSSMAVTEQYRHLAKEHLRVLVDDGADRAALKQLTG